MKWILSLFQPCLSFSSADFCDVRRLQQFLLSVTAKDVSLLITFRKIASPELEATDHRSAGEGQPKDNLLPSVRMAGQSFRMMISVIDLDPKPINRIRRWLKQKDEMLKTYSNFKNTSA